MKASAPATPGQDYITPQIDLIGKTIVVSIEPFPDDCPGPYSVKPLSLTAKAAGDGVLQTMTAAPISDLPTATIVISAGG